MLEENWCGTFSKPLAVFNKAFIRRLGKGLHPYIQLEGSVKDCAYCIGMEARLFYDNGLYESDEVLPFEPDSKNRGVYAAGEWVDANIPLYKKLSENGSLLFFTRGGVQRANHYDVTGCEVYSFREQFLKVIDMPCDDGIFDIIAEKYPDVFGYDIETAANNTMLCHYSQYDDDVIHADDFRWVEEGEEEKTGDSSPNPKKESEAAEAAEKAEKAEKEEPHTEEVEEPAGTAAEGPREEPAPQEQEQSVTDEDKDKEQELTDENNPTLADENTKEDDSKIDVPATPDEEKPAEKSVDEETASEELAGDKEAVQEGNQSPETDDKKSATKKSPKKKRNAYGLTEEDERHNQELLSDVRKEYTELLKYVISQKSSIWKPIERIVRNSLETNDYSESVILKYLELTKDVTTDLYTRLYTVTEPIRRKFEDGVKRKYKKLVCYNCSAQWKVDVTFMGKDHDESECPICQSSVGYDKD